MRRIACLLVCLAVLAPAAPALAQQDPFGPLPQTPPTPAPTPETDDGGSLLGDDVGRTTLYIIAGALIVSFVFIGWFISRDARHTLPRHAVSDEAARRRADPKVRHRREREKERARKKTKAQRQARKAHRKR